MDYRVGYVSLFVSFALMGYVALCAASALAQGTTVTPGIPGSQSQTSPVGLIVNFYEFALMVGGLLAFGGVVYGAVKYTLAAGNPSGQTDARDQITQALIGLLLLVSIYIILNFVNPDLTHLRLPTLQRIAAPVEGGTPTGGGALIPGVQLPHENAMEQLQSAGITIASGINLAGVRQATINEAIQLRAQCNCNVTVNSATGGVHETGRYSHANGYKIDLDDTSALNAYILNPNNFRRIGVRTERDGTRVPLYQRPSGGAIYAQESTHWDVTVGPR